MNPICIGGMITLLASYFVQMDNPKDATRFHNYMACIAAEKCEISPEGTRCLSFFHEEDQSLEYKR